MGSEPGGVSGAGVPGMIGAVSTFAGAGVGTLPVWSCAYRAVAAHAATANTPAVLKNKKAIF
jgi:hypothetical protein